MLHNAGRKKGQVIGWGCRESFLEEKLPLGLEGWTWVWEGAFQEQGAVSAKAPGPGHHGSFQELQAVVCIWRAGREAEAEAEAGGYEAGQAAGSHIMLTQMRKCLWTHLGKCKEV